MFKDNENIIGKIQLGLYHAVNKKAKAVTVSIKRRLKQKWRVD